MKKNLILLVALLLCGNFLFAQRLHEYVAATGQYMYFSHPCTGIPPFGCGDKEDQVKTEYPPYIIAANGTHSYFLTNGNGSSVASSASSMITSTEINFRHGDGPVRVTHESTANVWTRDYYCVYSAQYLFHPTHGAVSIAFTEGENYSQNGSSPCNWMQTSAATTYLCLTWTPNNANTNWGHQWFTDMGPIIWPAAGYFYNGTKSSLGCANNTTIQGDDGYLYVFYADQSCDEVGAQIGPGRQGGIKVARAPINDALNPHAYRTFYEDASGVHWNPSLPAGLTKANIQSYVDGALGPQGTSLLEPGRGYTRFAVAKVVGGSRPYYMGLGNYQDPDHGSIDPTDGKWYHDQVTTLKYSYDLLHWSDDKEIYRSPNHKTSNFNYPIFLRSDGWTNTTIDENEFYIVGTSPENPSIDNFTYRKRIYIPPPTPQPGPGGPIACNRYMYLANDPSDFNGASGARMGDLDITGNKLTIEAVFNRTEDYGWAVDGGMLVSKHNYSTDVNYFLCPKRGGITTTDGYFQVDLPCDLETNTTFHVAMVYDGAQLSIYRNGSLEASVQATGNLITNDYPTTIGTGANFSNRDPSMNFRGYVGEVRIWKNARTQQEIQLYKHQTIANAYYHPDLLAYFSTGYFGFAPQGMELFGNASYDQTNTSCTIDTYGCFGPARKGNSTTKEDEKGSLASSVNVVIYPNPASRSATLAYRSNVAGTVTINVIDVTGKTAMVMKKPVMKGGNAINLDLHSLSNGVYSVQLVDGKKTLTKKLVINK